MKQLIVYDLDGTLVDTKADIAHAVNYMLGQLQRPVMAPEAICRYVGRGLSQLISSCLRETVPARIEEGIQIYRAYYAAHLLDYSRLYPGVREVLDYFAPRTQAVITNKPDPYSRGILRGLGILERFVDVVTGDSTFPKKPDPASLRELMATHHVSAQQTLMVGDSPIDVETGRRAGVVTVGVTQGFSDARELVAAQPDVCVRHFPELLDEAHRRGW